MSGAATGGFLAARAGLKSMAMNAAIGGLILAAMEGGGIAFQRVVLPWIEKKMSPQSAEKIDLLEPPIDPTRPRRKFGLMYDAPPAVKPDESIAKSWKLW